MWNSKEMDLAVSIERDIVCQDLKVLFRDRWEMVGAMSS